MKPLVYIAGPYSSDPVSGTRAAIKAGMAVYETGLAAVLIPHTTMLVDLLLPHDVEFWYAYDLDQLEHCQAVLRLDGPSTGADAEVAFAKANEIPVYRLLDELIQGLHSGNLTRQRWWVSTELLAEGGRKIAGPFTTWSDALHARTAIEKLTQPTTYWVDDEVLR